MRADTPAADLRYGVYLRPAPALCRAQAVMHDLLARQYGLRAAGRFMPHATLKGFFRSAADAATLAAVLAPVVSALPPFPVWNQGPIAFPGDSVVLDIHHRPDGGRNEPLHALHLVIADAMAPFVSANCDFTPREGRGDWFFAHLTLAMADLVPEYFDEVFAFIQALAPIGPATFTAERVHLYRFTSEDWGGAWWETLHWELLASWRLSPTER